METIDDGYLILVPDAQGVIHLIGDQARAFDLAVQGVDSVPSALQAAMAGLIELGVVETNQWSRRRIIQLGGATAAAGVAMIALPSIAAAASGPVDPPDPVMIELAYLVVAGGGGGSIAAGGGGGAGGVREGSQSVGQGTFAVSVGGGGKGARNVSDLNLGYMNELPTSGAPSSIAFPVPVTTVGGGHGGLDSLNVSGSDPGSGGDGGSGGGGSGVAGSTLLGGSGTSGEGHDGGNGFHGGDLGDAGGGGGGAGAPGADVENIGDRMDGGDGVISPLATVVGIGEAIGSDRWVGGGGAGGGDDNYPMSWSLGGRGGGDTDSYSGAGSGLLNSGGGGGTGQGYDSHYPGGNGGSGVVIIGYNTSAMGAAGFVASAKDGDGTALTSEVHGAMTYWVFKAVGSQGELKLV